MIFDVPFNHHHAQHRKDDHQVPRVLFATNQVGNPDDEAFAHLLESLSSQHVHDHCWIYSLPGRWSDIKVSNRVMTAKRVP